MPAAVRSPISHRKLDSTAPARRRADSLFESQAPGAVQVVVGVSAEGHHGLGAGDAWDLGYSLGDDVGQALEIGDTDHDDEIVGACDGVSLGDAIYCEHGLGSFLHTLPLRPDEHYCRYHADSLKPSSDRSNYRSSTHRFPALRDPFPEKS